MEDEVLDLRRLLGEFLRTHTWMRHKRAILPWGACVSVLAVAVLFACHDATRSEPPAAVDLDLIELSYECENNFDLTNGNSMAVTVQFEVEGTGESGELTLAAAAAPGQPSQARLTTVQRGGVVISYLHQLVTQQANTDVVCPPPVPAPSQPQATMGEWTAPFAWPVVAVHLQLLPSGKVLSWGREGVPQLWDPETGEFTPAPATSDLFCAGHTFLPDGRLLVAGGHISDDHGLPDVNLFDPSTQSWTPVSPMAHGRWYPTLTTLSDGRVVALSGGDQDGNLVVEPELWNGETWTPLPGAARELPYYPRTFAAPNGLVFYAGELPEAGYLDVSGEGSWTPVASSHYGRREYGSAVMYRPGKILIVGGSNPAEAAPTSSAEIIDLTEPAPSWRFTGSMANARRQFNATLLPDGRVIATGGTSAAGFSEPAGAVHAAEVWNPDTEQWAAWAGNSVTRVYHSTTLLLPDGRLLHTGSGDGHNLPRELNAELYSPPYLFHGVRPVIASAPQTVDYGGNFFVATPDAGTVTRATWVRLSAVTHAFDQNQRFNELSLRRSAGGVTLTAPGGENLAPPGDYMLFLLTGDGVPSPARIVRLN
jgi:galactose oxidase